jgi:hypothetical protein
MAGPGKPGRAKGHPNTGGRTKGGVDKIKREAILAAQGITIAINLPDMSDLVTDRRDVAHGHVETLLRVRQIIFQIWQLLTRAS